MGHKPKDWIISRWLPYIVFAFLALVVLLQLLNPGYILTLDMVFAPNEDITIYTYGLSADGWITAAAPYMLIQHWAYHFMPAWVFQKVILFLILFLCGLGGYKLLPKLGIGSYYAGLLYTINPFTYTRFMAGQWGILWAYAFTPFAVLAFIELLKKQNCKSTFKVVIFTTVAGLFQVHSLFLLILAFAILFIVKMMQVSDNKPVLLRLMKSVAITAGTYGALNLYWIIPSMTADHTLLSQVGLVDLNYFAPKNIPNISTAFTVASLHGFWRLGYIYLKDFTAWWWILFLVILFFAIYGTIGRQSKHRISWKVTSVATIGAISLFLAIAATITSTRAPFEWLWENFPLIRAFRDSHKFVALLCLTYAYLGGLGVNKLVTEIGKSGKALAKTAVVLVSVISLLTPVIYTLPMFGSYGQLRATDYPQEWYMINQYLNQDTDDFNVLVLPWHRYMDFSWLPNKEKRLENPAQKFFDKPIIQGDNIEVPGIFTQSLNPISQYIEFLLQKKDTIANFGEMLLSLDIKYVILFNESDYREYDFLYRQDDLQTVIKNDKITLFKNMNPTARAYAVSSVIYIKSLEEYVNYSKIQDVKEHLYILGDGEDSACEEKAEDLEVTKKSPIKFHITGSNLKYTIFTVPQNISTNHWRYNGKKPMKNLGFMPAFPSSPERGEAIYQRFYQIYLPSYALSFVTLAVILCTYFFTAIEYHAIRRIWVKFVSHPKAK